MPGGHPVEVGTTLAGRPPHRSERAELPHSALALGPNAQPHGWIGMTDMRIRQPAFDPSVHPFPGDLALLSPLLQGSSPVHHHLLSEGTKGRALPGHPVIPVMPKQNHPQPLALFRDRLMHPSLQFRFDFPQLRPHALLHRLPKHTKLSLPGLSTPMEKSQKAKN